jgi:hypothetical protein
MHCLQALFLHYPGMMTSFDQKLMPQMWQQEQCFHSSSWVEAIGHSDMCHQLRSWARASGEVLFRSMLIQK